MVRREVQDGGARDGSTVDVECWDATRRSCGWDGGMRDRDGHHADGEVDDRWVAELHLLAPPPNIHTCAHTHINVHTYCPMFSPTLPQAIDQQALLAREAVARHAAYCSRWVGMPAEAMQHELEHAKARQEVVRRSPT